MTRARLGIVLESGARIGAGKVALLESLQASSSIQAAARVVEMTFKRAWLLLDSLNQAFIEPLSPWHRWAVPR